MKLPRRKFLQLAINAGALPAVGQKAWAQAYPTRPNTLIVPFAAGGVTDVIARIVAERVSRALGQPLIVENIAGAGGTNRQNLGRTHKFHSRPHCAHVASKLRLQSHLGPRAAIKQAHGSSLEAFRTFYDRLS